MSESRNPASVVVFDETQDGITLRDLFAVFAMAGELASQSDESCFREPMFGMLARRSYAIADAMLAEREKEVER